MTVTEKETKNLDFQEKLQKVAELINNWLHIQNLVYKAKIERNLIQLTSPNQAQAALRHLVTEKKEELLAMNVRLGRHNYGIFLEEPKASNEPLTVIVSSLADEIRLRKTRRMNPAAILLAEAGFNCDSSYNHKGESAKIYETAEVAKKAAEFLIEQGYKARSSGRSLVYIPDKKSDKELSKSRPGVDWVAKREYMFIYKKKQRKDNHEFTIIFPKKGEEMGKLEKAAEAYNSIPAYIKAVTLAALNGRNQKLEKIWDSLQKKGFKILDVSQKLAINVDDKEMEFDLSELPNLSKEEFFSLGD